MTKRWLTVLVVAALALTTAGCGDDEAEPGNVPVPSASSRTSAGASSSASTQAAPADPAENPDVADTVAPEDDTEADGDTEAADDAAPGAGDFVTVVKQKLPAVATDRRDEEIALVAEQACAGLSAGLSAGQVTAETQTLGTQDAAATDEGTARQLVKLAIDTVCPDQAKRVDEF